MKKTLLNTLTFVSLCIASVANAQVGIGVPAGDIHPSAELEVKSTEKGFLLPRMTKAQRIAIGSPATGLIVYQTDGDVPNPAGLYYFDGLLWKNGIGAQGIQGPAGATGPQGPVGAVGPKGDTGPIGPIGPQGVQGLTGPVGATGENGAVGPKGDTGLQGIKGDKGETGADGAQGLPGAKGDTGDQGIQGPKGDKGEVGPAGEQGLPSFVYANAYPYPSSIKTGVLPTGSRTYCTTYSLPANITFSEASVVHHSFESDTYIIAIYRGDLTNGVLVGQTKNERPISAYDTKSLTEAPGQSLYFTAGSQVSVCYSKNGVSSLPFFYDSGISNQALGFTANKITDTFPTSIGSLTNRIPTSTRICMDLK